MKHTAYSVALILLVISFLSGTLVLITLIWLEGSLGETAGKLLITSGVVFLASGITCIFLREVRSEEHLKKDSLIN